MSRSKLVDPIDHPISEGIIVIFNEESKVTGTDHLPGADGVSGSNTIYRLNRLFAVKI